jgi:hypothetical protein
MNTTEQRVSDYQREGGPLAGGSYAVGSQPMTYERALEIARGKHPSRVLANTNGYRYGRFTEVHANGSVRVDMMGSHIASFYPNGVQLWSRGYATPSTTEALGALVTGGWFFTSKGVVMFRSYGVDASPDCRPLTEGQLFPYPDPS